MWETIQNVLGKKKPIDSKTLWHNRYPYEAENLDKPCMDMISTDVNKAVPWYLVAIYGRSIDVVSVSDSTLRNLRRRLIEHWDDLDHPLKEYISYEELVAKKHEGNYPPGVGNALQAMRKAYDL